MNLKPLLGMAFGLLVLQTITFSQDKLNIKYGKVAPADFDISKHSYDSGAAAVVIADVGESHLEGSTKGWFKIVFHHFKRIKILDKKALSEIGTIEIPLYTDGKDPEIVYGLKATTYNLENGKVVETKLDDKSIFNEKTSPHYNTKKFTFPAVKEGSIIEVAYTKESDYLFSLEPWAFQGNYPCFWSEYEVGIPEFFNYVFLGQGYSDYFMNRSDSHMENFRIIDQQGTERPETWQKEATVNTHKWVMKDVPALKSEKYTSTVQNYIAKVEFQLSSYMMPGGSMHEIMGNWETLTTRLLESDDFGADLKRNNGWLGDEMKTITAGAGSNLEKAMQIYVYVRDHFSCSGHGHLTGDNPIKTVFKNKNGNEAEINILLTAMMKYAGLDSDPVILSTKANGFINELYPKIDRFNYVITRVKVDNSEYYLDASFPALGFGSLSSICYNGAARIISSEHPGVIYFNSDSLKESSVTSVLIINDEKGAISGGYQSMLGGIESFNFRTEIKSSSEKEYFNHVQTAYGPDFLLENFTVDSLHKTTMPIKISYDFTLKPNAGDNIFYFNPMMADATKENPFKATDRKYPVEMLYQRDETYVLNMEVPEGYEVEELPKSAKVALNGEEGFYEYLIQKNATGIQLRARLKLNKATFQPDDYSTLRDFYTFIVNKESEQIVFKKKK